jgi:O-antigen ligase
MEKVQTPFRRYLEEFTLLTFAFYPWYGRLADSITPSKSYWFDLLYFVCVYAVIDYKNIRWKKVMRFAPFLLVFFWSAALNGVPFIIFKESLRRVVFPFGVMLFASAVDWDYKKLRRFMIYITISGLLMGCVAGYQFITKQAPQSEWLDTQLDTDTSIIRVWSIFSIPTYYSIFVDISILIALGLLLTSKKWLGRIIWGLSLVGFLIAQLLTYSRGGLLASAFGLFVSIATQSLLWAVLVAGGAVIVAVLVPQVRDRLFTAFTWAYLQESSQPGGRIYEWGRSLENVGIVNGFRGIKRLLLGTGPGTFGTQASINLGLHGALRIDSAYFAVLAEYGILGAVAFVFFVVSTLLEGLKKVLSANDRYQKLLLACVLGALSAWAFHGLTDNVFDYFYILPWVFSLSMVL